MRNLRINIENKSFEVMGYDNDLPELSKFPSELELNSVPPQQLNTRELFSILKL